MLPVTPRTWVESVGKMHGSSNDIVTTLLQVCCWYNVFMSGTFGNDHNSVGKLNLKVKQEKTL